MTDPIRTPAEALEAAAQEAEACDYPRSCPTADEAVCYDAMALRISEAIRAIASRIPPAPDDEALAEMCARALARTVVPDDPDDENERWPEWYDEALAVIAALREAGALR